MTDTTDSSLRFVFSSLKRHRLGMVVIFLITVAGAIAYALLAQPIYRVQVVLLPASDSDRGALGSLIGQFGGLASLAGLGGAIGGTNREEAIAVLKSRDFTERFIQQRSLLPKLFSDDWDEKASSWKSSDPDEIPTLADGAEMFDDEIRRVTVDEVSSIVTLVVDWRDRVEAVQWAKDLVSELNAEMRQRAVSDSQRSLDYLNAEAAKTSVLELREAIFKVVETQIKSVMLASVREEYALRTVDPPTIPDPDKHIWPKRGLIGILGVVIGLVLSVMYALGCDAFLRLREQFKSA